MKWKPRRIAALSILSLTVAGCSQAIEIEKPDFCDLTETRYFTKTEAQVRAERFPTNLRKDITQNQLRDELCDDA